MGEGCDKTQRERERERERGNNILSERNTKVNLTKVIFYFNQYYFMYFIWSGFSFNVSKDLIIKLFIKN